MRFFQYGQQISWALVSAIVLVIAIPIQSASALTGATAPADKSVKPGTKPPPRVGATPKRSLPTISQMIGIEPDAFREARQQGLVVDGYKDTQGLKRVIEDFFENTHIDNSLGLDSKFEDWARDAGIDHNTLQELESLANLVDLDVYRVEFIPGILVPDLGSAPDPGSPSAEEFGNNQKDNPFAAIFPTGQSLVSIKGAVREEYDSVNGTTIHFSDGSVFHEHSTDQRDGTKLVTTLVIRDRQGNIEYSGTRRYHTETATPLPGSEPYDPPNDGPSSQAENYREDRDQRQRAAEATDSGGKPSAADKPGQGDYDKFQPGDGDSAFCPMTVEVCRRGREKAIASGKSVFVGSIFVNPGPAGDPDDYLNANRLIYDPEDLVINPSNPDAIRDSTNRNPKSFKMVLPVWVLPPGPANLKLQDG